MDAKRFGAFISERRKEHHMTQADLAGKVGVTDKAVSRWERGLGFPDINTMEPLAEANIINLRLDITHLYYPAKNSFQKGRLKRREIFTELLLYTLTT